MSTDMVNKDYHLHSQFAVVQRNIHLLMGNWVCPAFACIHGGPDNMVNFCLLTAEICWRVWGTPANFNGFRVLAALLHGIPVLGVSQTLRRWTEGATYIRRAAITLGIGPHSSWKKMFLISLNPTSSCGTALTLGYAVWRAIEQLVYCHKIQDIEHLKELLHSCWETMG